jgi:hypothetical protein
MIPIWYMILSLSIPSERFPVPERELSVERGVLLSICSYTLQPSISIRTSSSYDSPVDRTCTYARSSPSIRLGIRQDFDIYQNR